MTRSEDEFERVYRRYFGDVYRFLLRLCRDEPLAEELTAETFFRALEAIDGFKGSCELRVWLCQIAKNLYFDHERKQKRVDDVDDVDALPIADGRPGAEERLVRKADAERLHRILHELPEPYKEVFTLRVFGELGFRQIGELFGKSENWACVTFHRAKSRIAERMEPGYGRQ